MTSPNSPATRGGSADQDRRGLARFATENAVRLQRHIWSRRVASWDQHGSANLGPATAAVLAAATAGPGAQAVDLGCGTGQISLPLAARGYEVLAVDVSPAMIAQLEATALEATALEATALEATALEATAQGQTPGRVDGVALPIENLMLPEGSVDLIVSSYALHHLRDADKALLVSKALHWLRPGGQLVIADMMFGRGLTQRDRAIIKSKVVALAKKGPGGLWRIAKNVVRYQFRVQERPVSMEKWTSMLAEAGFADITADPIVAEAGIVTGRRQAG